METAKLQANMTYKEKEQLAQTRLIARIGTKAFFALSLKERDIQRKQELQVLNDELNGKDIVVHPLQPIQPSEQFEESKKDVKLAPEAFPQDIQPFIEPEKLQPHKHESFALDITLNAKQTLAAEYAESGKCFVLTGAAGTGKTTACREIAKRLLKADKLGTHDFKIQGERVLAPSIAFCSYTNRATDNIRRALHKDPELEAELEHNVLTIHKLLEFEPIFYDIIDKDTGEERTTMRFEAQRTAKNPLRLTHLVIEESSMLGTDLGALLMDALPRSCQIIYVGDINQLPPIFAKSMLNYALVLLPLVELTEVYRQALESPIITNAHLCLAGKKLEDSRPFFQIVNGNNLKVIPTESKCVNNLVNSLKTWNAITELDADGLNCAKYDPEQDIILSPFNKGEAGTIVLNSHIAQFLGSARKEKVWEVFAGMRKLYLAMGDRVMINKQDGFITRIARNARYIGRAPRLPSLEMTRFGTFNFNTSKESEQYKDEDLEAMMKEIGYGDINVDAIDENDTREKQNEASHIIDITLESGQVVTLNSVGDFGDNVFSLGYALTVHKAQGCEWRKVIILLHRNHATMLTRELLYTAITRSRRYCIIVDLCNRLEGAIAIQRIKGNSVAEKIEWFNSEVSLTEPVSVIPLNDFDLKPLPPTGRKAKPVEKFSGFESKNVKPAQIIRLSSLVSEAFKQEAEKQLQERWTRAKLIFGDKIGNIPTLDYELQNKGIVGLAKMNKGQILLNPLWCVLAEKNAEVKEQMLGETLDHEICHIVAARYSNDRKHDKGWVTAMQLMGREAKITADMHDLPSWAEGYKAVANDLANEQLSKTTEVNGVTIAVNTSDDYIKSTDDIA